MRNTPFQVGQSVITVSDFSALKKVWGFNYPKQNSIVTIASIKKHHRHNFWLVTINGCECELCHTCFAPIKSEFQPIAFKEVVEVESPMVSAN